MNDDASELARALLLVDDLGDMLFGQRLEIEAIRRVIVSRDGFRIAVHHHAFNADIGHRESGVTAAIVELDPLADPVGAAAENDRLLAVRRQRFAGRTLGPESRMLISRIKIRGLGCEFGGAGVDPLIDRTDVQAMANGANLFFSLLGQLAKAGVGKAHGFKICEVACGGRQSVPLDRIFSGDDLCDLTQEPEIDTGGFVDVFDRQPFAKRLGDDAQPIGCLFRQRSAERPDTAKADLIEPIQACFERAECLLQTFLEVSTDRHRLANGFHSGCQHRLCAFKFLECEARDLGDDIINGRFERGGRDTSNVIVELVQRIAHSELGGDFRDREAGRLGGQCG